MGWLEDLGNGAAAVASTVGDATEALVGGVAEAGEQVLDGATDAAQDAVDTATGWVAANGGAVLGAIANVVGGIITGGLEQSQAILEDVLHIAGDLGDLAGDILSADLPELIADLGDLGIDLLDLGADGLRAATGGYFVGAIVDNFEREELRAFVERRVRTRFDDADRRDAILNRLKIRSGDWGLPFEATSTVLMLDSRNTDLRAMHNDGELDLYAIAGLLSLDRFDLGRPRFMLRHIDFNGQQALLPPSRLNISQFLDGTSGGHFQLFALRPEALNDALKVARSKFRKLGVKLNWNDQFDIPTLGQMTTSEIKPSAYRLAIHPSEDQARFFAAHGIKPADEREEPVRAVAAFHYKRNSDGKEIYGQVCGRDVNDDFAVQRVDAEGKPLGSGVVYRDIYPGYFARYILAHELGHYFGLKHDGHGGVQNIMFSTAGGSQVFDLGLWRYYMYSEPQFTLEDGKDAWRYLLRELADLL